MTALSQRLVVVPALGGAAWRLALPLGALHAAMFVYDLAHPDRFLNADRAGERIQVVEGFARAVRSGDLLAYLTSHGIVGDWLPQALLYAAGGQYFVIAALGPLIHVFAKERRRAYLLLAFAPLVAWMSVVFVASGEFSMGRSGHDLGNNIYYRLQRVGGALPPAERPAVRPDGETKATLGEYAAFAVSHPVLMAKYAAIDMAVMGFKSGIERVVLDYLYLYPEERSELKVAETGWRSRVDRGGVGALLELARQQPVLIATASAGALAFTLLMLLAAYGARRWARSRERLALVAFVFYIFAT